MAIKFVPDPPPPRDAREEWFLGVWADREDRLYPALMECDPEDRPALITIPEELFQALGLKDIEPWWLHHGVLEYPPQVGTPHREGVWTYITTGLSNPWGMEPATADPKGPSGLGLELVMRTAEQAPWAVRVLHWLSAMQILQGMGRVQGELVQDGMIVPLSGPIDPSRPETPIQYLVLVHALPQTPRHQLASGWFELLLALGIDQADRDAMLADEGQRLVEVWKRTNGVTRP